MPCYKNDYIGFIQELAPSHEGVKYSRTNLRNLDTLPKLQKDSVTHQDFHR